MTVASSTSEITYTGSPPTTDFSFPYLVLDSSHIEVYHDSVLQGSGYTVSGVGTASVTIAHATAPAAGVEILIRRVVPLTQSSDYVENDPTAAATLEGDFDLSAMRDQQLNTGFAKTLRAPDGEVVGDMVLGAKSSRANKYLQFDANGLPSFVAANDESGTLVTSSSGTTARSLATRFDDVINVKDYGATGDGVTDDTTAIQAAIDIGGDVFFPDGVYVVTSPLTVAIAGQHLFGLGQARIQQTTSATRALTVSASNVLVEDLEFEGPTSGDTQVTNEDAIYLFGADSSNYITNVRVRGCRLFNWGDAAIRCLFVDNARFVGNTITRIGHYGVLVLSGNYTQVNENRIDNISPGLGGTAPRLNAYGITFTRNQTDTTTAPQCVGCIAARNIITNIPSWEGLDTHAGVQCQFIDNFVRDVSLGVVVANSDDGGGTFIPPSECVIRGNTVVCNTAASGDPVSTGIIVGATGTASNGTGFIVEGNVVKQFGREDADAGWEHGALRVYNANGVVVADNYIINSNMIAIDLKGEQLGTTIVGNVIQNVTQTNSVDDAISVQTNTVRGLIDHNIITQSAAGTPVAIAMSTAPAAGYGMVVGVNNALFGTVTLMSGTDRGRVIGGSLIRSPHAWCTFDGTAADPISIGEGFNVDDVTKNATGDYTVNFTTALGLSNYIVTVAASEGYVEISAKAVGSVRFVTRDNDNSLVDPAIVDVVVLGRG